jgi:hypothetical protein
MTERAKRNSLTKERCLEISKAYTTRAALRKGNVTVFCLMFKHGWIADAPWLALVNKRWTRADVEAEAAKYEGRWAFYEGSPKAYAAAQRNGYLKEILSRWPDLRLGANRSHKYPRKDSK